jgi:hypothetical protein
MLVKFLMIYFIVSTLQKNTNTTFFSNIGFWVISPKAETQYADIYRKCMQGRNHQVLN